MKLARVVRFYSSTPHQSVRVRFAPSPTGFLHLGGLRTALYNYFFAQSCNGKFILRIEDTDQSRLVPGALEQIQEDLEWSGIEIHEGPRGGEFGSYIQSQRINLYKEHVKTLLDNGSAYHCFCTERRLEMLRKQAMKAREIPRYDNRCKNLDAQEVKDKLQQGIQYCVRFKLSPGPETFKDMVYGNITYDTAANEGDPIIIKSDGFPTYHFANVVDDHLMQISHVLRGVEWQISTNKHLQLYRAFNWKPPSFAHLPLLLNADGSKLSKRQGDIKIDHYRKEGVFPLALINFIVNSGGGFVKDLDRNLKPQCWTVEELTQQFNINRLNSHSGKLMPDRLSEFNRLELKRKLKNHKEEQQLVEKLQEMVKNKFTAHESLELDFEHVRNILHWSVDRITKMSDLLSKELSFVWVSPKKFEIDDHELVQIGSFIAELEQLHVMNKDVLNGFFRSFSDRNGLKYGGFMRTLRSILSGLKEGPSVAEMMEILGKRNTLSRLQGSIESRK